MTLWGKQFWEDAYVCKQVNFPELLDPGKNGDI